MKREKRGKKERNEMINIPFINMYLSLSLFLSIYIRVYVLCHLYGLVSIFNILKNNRNKRE